MSNEPAPTLDDDLPHRVVTMNQIVAYNIAYFRKANALTQEELGKRLEEITGKKWSKATMSAVERSWDGSRVRSFDADDLLAFSRALECPVSGLLLPPEDDGTVIEYGYENVGTGTFRASTADRPGTATDLLSQLFASEYEKPSEQAFYERVRAAFDFYFGDIPEGFFVNVRPEYEDDFVMREHQVLKLRGQISTLREVMATLDRAAKRIDEADAKAHKEWQRKQEGEQ
jgi:hypothetical protein